MESYSIVEDGARTLPFDYRPPLKSKKPRKWPPITPEMHEKIKRLYQHKVAGSGEVKAFADRHHLPKWKITRYAICQGWTDKQKKNPEWTAPELSILEHNAQHCEAVIQRKLKKAGFTRSLVAIGLKLKRMRFRQNINGQSAQQLAACLGEDVHFVLRAIHSGLLKAQRRITNRTEKQGGDIFLIRDRHARQFIVENIHRIDLRKVEKYWFVDLLTNGGENNAL